MPRELDRTTRGSRVAPESLDGTQNRAHALPRELSKNEKWKLNILEGKPSPRKENVNNIWENIKLQSTFFEPYMCHINPPPSAPCRPTLPHVAQKHPQRPNKSLTKEVFRSLRTQAESS